MMVLLSMIVAGLLAIMGMGCFAWTIPAPRMLRIPIERVIATRTGEVRGDTLRIWLDGEGVIPIKGLKAHSGALVKVTVWEA